LVKPILDFFEITPNIILKTADEQPYQLASFSSHCLNELSSVIHQLQPDVILVQGDTSTAFMGALAGFYAKKPVIHLEAGLRSFSLKSPFPEEAHRIMIDQISSFLLAPTERALEHLRAENIEQPAWVVGNTSIDALRLGTQEAASESGVPPTGGRVVAIGLDTRTERWRHERPKVASLGGPPPKPLYKDVGDPVASGIAVAGGVVYFTTVASGKLLALDAATGEKLKEFDVGPVWSGPSVSRGRIYVGTGNTLLSPFDYEAFFPKKSTGVLHSFGLPGKDEVDRLGAGKEADAPAPANIDKRQ
jgi:hypothetical protein